MKHVAIVAIRTAVGRMGECALYRKEIKNALKQLDFTHMWKVFCNIDFLKCEGTADDYKTAAFQLGQALGLMQGIELYTKGEVTQQFYPIADDDHYR